MAIKKVAYQFNPFKQNSDIKVPRGNKEEAQAAVKEYVLAKVADYVGNAKSPVSGGKWKVKLTPGYEKIKGKGSVADLQLSSDMLNAMEVVAINSEKLSLQVEGEQAGKADGNNRGTYGRYSPIPGKAREFIPKEGQDFKAEIKSGIRNILKEYEEE